MKMPYLKNINKIILVSKNVCHSEFNCINKIHTESFLEKYNLDTGKRLHDLLMVKEGLNLIYGNLTICNYLKVIPVLERKNPDNMSIWGCEIDENSNVEISVGFNSNNYAH